MLVNKLTYPLIKFLTLEAKRSGLAISSSEGVYTGWNSNSILINGVHNCKVIIASLKEAEYKHMYM